MQVYEVNAVLITVAVVPGEHSQLQSWSTGSVQYVPLIYGKTPAAAALSVHPLVESTGVHTILVSGGV